ncbi:MAG: ZIP family metal transporter [Patescibacteria group bacterium]
MIWVGTLAGVILVSLLSLIGAITLFVNHEKLQKVLLYFVSFSVGALFGEVFLHIIPEISEEFGFSEKMGMFFLAGVLIFFMIEKFVHWHHCHRVDHDHKKLHPVAFTNLLGDALHNFLDGVIIAGAFAVSWSLGIATTLAVIAHEVPQEIGDFGVLLFAGMSKKKALLFNLFSASLAILGAVLTLLVAQNMENILPYILAVAGGGFIYIAGSDLIPELHRDSRLSQTFGHFVFVLVGLAVMFGLKIIG